MPVRDLLMGTAGASSAPAVYVDDVFSTYLYTGNGSTQTITNGIDLADNGGLVWIKDRTSSQLHRLYDTARTGSLSSNTTSAESAGWVPTYFNFNSNGFFVNNSGGVGVNTNNENYASWTFRKQPKFFDIVTWTGDGNTSKTLSHNLGSVPGCIIVKNTSNTYSWPVYHNGLNGGVNPEQYYCYLNSTQAQTSSSGFWNNTAPTSTQFTVGNTNGVNASGNTYVAYIFADQAGGFGATGTDSAIACNYYTGTGATGNFVSLGWEPQYLLIKKVNSASHWFVFDVMRQMSYTDANILYPDLSDAELDNGAQLISPTATGFVIATNSSTYNASGSTYIYIAIRRPMKPPTTGTSVFAPSGPVDTSTGHPNLITTNFPVDLSISCVVSGTTSNKVDFDRLRGNSVDLSTNTTTAESSGDGPQVFDNNTAIGNNYWGWNPVTFWNFRRAPKFFDIVCATASGYVVTSNHNLMVTPEIIISKDRNNASDWYFYANIVNSSNFSLKLNTNDAASSLGGFYYANSTAFSIVTAVNTTSTQVVYLFATCAGVSKVGSYTGNATGQSIACGFGSGGARFVLIKRTDSTGDWYCFDSANGLTSSSSPYLLWNTTAAQTTGNNGVYASSGGFTLGATALSTTNIVGASYIFLAIA